MSAATLDEYTSVNAESSSVKSRSPRENQSNRKDIVIAERARILETVARKAQEKTLTLEETTDLYARFNRTYESNYQSKKQPQEDESWALQLLEECAQETDADCALQTRVNGEPQAQQALKLVKPLQGRPDSKQTFTRPGKPLSLNTTLEQTLFADDTGPERLAEDATDKPKLNLREAFIYDQFNFADDLKTENARKNANRTFWIILSLSSLFTLATLIGLSQFL